MITTKVKINLPKLPTSVTELVDKLNSGEELGASRNIRQINDLFCAISESIETDSPNELIETIKKTGDYFIETRGKNTPAFENAISLFLSGIDDIPDPDIYKIKKFLNRRRDRYNKQSLKNIKVIANYGANLIMECQTILAFDYSSSVLAVFNEVANRGKKLHLIVPESRDLDGGRPIVNEATAKGHSVHYVIDFAFHHCMRHVDAVMIGAETIFANGDCSTTVGSFPIAKFADYYNVPLYVPTELIKIDRNSYMGVKKPLKLDDYSELFDYPDSFKYPQLINVKSSAFDIVPANLISAYITEIGVMPSSNLWNASLKFLKSIGKNPLEDHQHE